jgi:DNA-directed RNA polymerase specialized sigma24 family protein
MDVAATARSLGLPEGTVKARLSRGRILLGERLTRAFRGFARG